LEELGAEIIVSPKTNKKIVERGVELGFNELCLPIKIYYGHMDYLLSHYSDLDYVFVPRYISLDPSGFYCPKFLSLPDAMRGNFDVLADPREKPNILEWEINAKKRLKIDCALRAGLKLCSDPLKVMAAYENAVRYYKNYQEVLRQGVPLHKALERVEKNQPLPDPKEIKQRPVTIFILGHPYNVYESYTNMDMMKKLEKMGVNVLTIENLKPEVFKGKRVKVSGKFSNYWGNEQEILQTSEYIFKHIGANDKNGHVDGVIFLISFACGPDSLIAEIVMRDMKKKHIPYMDLIVDEHTGSAGMQTRIETFVDMIKRKKLGAV